MLACKRLPDAQLLCSEMPPQRRGECCKKRVIADLQPSLALRKGEDARRRLPHSRRWDMDLFCVALCALAANSSGDPGEAERECRETNEPKSEGKSISDLGEQVQAEPHGASNSEPCEAESGR